MDVVMGMDEVEFECPDCGEPVDEYGDTLDEYTCSQCPIFCHTCGGGGECDQSC